MARRERWWRAGVLTGALIVVASCRPGPPAIQAERVAPLARGEIRYVAVLPFEAAAIVDGAPPEPGEEVRAEPAATTVRHALAEAMRALPAWQVTDEIVVGEAIRKLYGSLRAVDVDEAAAVGRLIGADAVVHGIVRRFERRIGAEYAARRPALVDFAVTLVLFPAGETVWHAEYAERQQPLSDDIWNLFGFLRARGRWLRAGELAAIGARQMAAEMHHTLYGGQATPVPRS